MRRCTRSSSRSNSKSCWSSWQGTASVLTASDGSKVANVARATGSTFTLGEVTPSYKPGVTLTDLAACLPDYAVAAIREALPVFGRQIANYDHPDAIMTGVETRTSSPIRITRGNDYQSVNTARLFPAGEGAGYAGGILSAAIDGIKVAEAVALSITGQSPA